MPIQLLYMKLNQKLSLGYYKHLNLLIYQNSINIALEKHTSLLDNYQFKLNN